ncbi:MAG: nucleotidyltransferase domain-containing protein [Bacteroidota bacterium]
MIQLRTIQDLFTFINDESILERFNLKKIGVFGSFARGEKFNDIDLMIDDDIDFKKLLELKIFLETKTGNRFDIMQKKYAEPVILYRAMKDLKYAEAS